MASHPGHPKENIFCLRPLVLTPLFPLCLLFPPYRACWSCIIQTQCHACPASPPAWLRSPCSTLRTARWSWGITRTWWWRSAVATESQALAAGTRETSSTTAAHKAKPDWLNIADAIADTKTKLDLQEAEWPRFMECHAAWPLTEALDEFLKDSWGSCWMSGNWMETFGSHWPGWIWCICKIYNKKMFNVEHGVSVRFHYR